MSPPPNFAPQYKQPDILLHSRPTKAHDHKLWSLNEKRTIKELYAIIDATGTTWPDAGVPITIYPWNPASEKVGEELSRDDDGNVMPGRYLLSYSYKDAESDLQKEILFSQAYPSTRTDAASSKAASRQGSQQQQPESGGMQDGPADQSGEQSRSGRDGGFKNRLVARDGGCVICQATGHEPLSRIEYEEDALVITGAHIIPVQYPFVWRRFGLKARMTDPFTDPSRPQARTDTMRMNSLENGILLCLVHHSWFDSLCFTIDPKSHRIFSLHPRSADLHGLEITKPWEVTGRTDLPPPHESVLKAHQDLALRDRLSMKARAKYLDLEDGGDDDDDAVLIAGLDTEYDDIDEERRLITENYVKHLELAQPPIS